MSDSYRFEVALSFAGDSKRDKVRAVAAILRDGLGEGRVFFDEWFEAELAGHDAQVVLQNIYAAQTRVVVTCVCQRYNEKPWTQEEWRAIQAFERDLRDASSGNLRRMRFLPLRFGDGDVDGLFKTAIVPDVRGREPREIADLILERLRLARGEPAVDRSSRGAHAPASAASFAAPAPTTPPPPRSPAGNQVAPPTPWAVASGCDQYGSWAAFEVASVRQRMRWIPPGRFLMGSPETELGRWADEGPRHLVTLTHGYWIGETPVTQALWRAAMGNNPSKFVFADQPVELVSWDDCQLFIDLVNGSLDGFALRLPTEAEWERACRGGAQGATWVGEPSGDVGAPELDAIAWYAGNSGNETHAVAAKAANPYGLYDMLGNVSEWCADLGIREYTAEPVTNPIGQGSIRVNRGGSLASGARCVRAAYRNTIARGCMHDSLGFRVAGSEPPVLYRSFY